ncbi:MAG: glutaredoxin family protein [Frankia sp.]
MTPDVDNRPERVTLLTRPGCHLCDDARAAVLRIAADCQVRWREVNIDTSAELADSYGDRVPVTLLDGREHGYWRVDEARLRRDLTVGRWPWRTRRAARNGTPTAAQDHPSS